MNVLFLAVGGTRRVNVVAEAATVLDGGGSAAVLISDPKPWRRDKIDRRVKLVEVGAIESSHAPLKYERKIMFGAPRKLLGARIGGAFTTRVSERLHARAVMPVYRRVWGERTLDLVANRVLGGGQWDYVVVSDPASIPYAERMIDRVPMRYSLDFVPTT